MPLTNTKIKNSHPRDKTYRLFDGGGLYLEIPPRGNKRWRYKYRHDDKEKRISLGVYPEASLKEARQKRADARKLLDANIDPSKERRAAKIARIGNCANSFEVITNEWLMHNTKKWSAGHHARIQRSLEKDVFPWLGRNPIVDINASDILPVLRRIEERGAVETAHRVLGLCSQVFRYAVATARAERDPCSDLRGALKPIEKNHLAAITDPDAVGCLLRAIYDYEGHFITRCALKLAPLVFVRPGELRRAEWKEFNLVKAEWEIPGNKMKMRKQHVVPLSKQAIEILQEVQPLTGESPFVFPSMRNFHEPMSENALNGALRRMGYSKEDMTSHGFRAMARTILDEVLGFRPDIIEHQLAHHVRDPNGRAYNRTTHLDERKKMMQEWADYLDRLRNEIKVIQTQIVGG